MHLEHDLTGGVVLREDGARQRTPANDDATIRLDDERSRSRPEKNPSGLLIWRTNVAVLAVSSMAYSTNRAAPVVVANGTVAVVKFVRLSNIVM